MFKLSVFGKFPSNSEKNHIFFTLNNALKAVLAGSYKRWHNIRKKLSF